MAYRIRSLTIDRTELNAHAVVTGGHDGSAQLWHKYGTAGTRAQTRAWHTHADTLTQTTANLRFHRAKANGIANERFTDLSTKSTSSMHPM